MYYVGRILIIALQGKGILLSLCWSWGSEGTVCLRWSTKKHDLNWRRPDWQLNLFATVLHQLSWTFYLFPTRKTVFSTVASSIYTELWERNPFSFDTSSYLFLRFLFLSPPPILPPSLNLRLCSPETFSGLLPSTSCLCHLCLANSLNHLYALCEDVVSPKLTFYFTLQSWAFVNILTADSFPRTDKLHVSHNITAAQLMSNGAWRLQSIICNVDPTLPALSSLPQLWVGEEEVS